MKFKIGDIIIKIDKLVLFVMIALILSSNAMKYFENFIACYLFVLFHEFSHVFIATLLGVKCNKIIIRISGANAVLEKTQLTNIKWLLIYLAGPISNIVLASLFKEVNIIRDINISLALVNMVPIFPLDGGNILKLILEFFMPRCRVDLIVKRVKKIVIIIIFFTGIILLIKYKNISLLLLLFYVVIL